MPLKTEATEYNLELSRKRAEAVKAKLVEMGIDAARLEVEALGEQQPIGDNSTTAGRVKSRRVEFKSQKITQELTNKGQHLLSLFYYCFIKLNRF